MNKYKQKTPHFGIPVVGYGDSISPEVEMRRYTIIENMLIAGTYGLSEVVFDDGGYTIEAGGGGFSVVLRTGGASPSARGLVGGFYFDAPPEVRWGGLKDGRLFYLYLRTTSKTPYESSSVRAVASERLLGKGALLLASVDLRDENPVVNTMPDGKVYSQDVANHVSDRSNPHGRSLVQDEIQVLKRLVMGEGAEIQVGEMVLPVGIFAAQAAEMAGRRVETVDFVSGGAGGVVVKASSRVFHIEVQRRCSGPMESTLAGEVGIGYFGEDDGVDSDSEFMVYNSHDEGVPMRALIVCG